MRVNHLFQIDCTEGHFPRRVTALKEWSTEEKSQAGRPGFFLIRAEVAGAYPATQRENCEFIAATGKGAAKMTTATSPTGGRSGLQ